jgi:hypothetical protein
MGNLLKTIYKRIFTLKQRDFIEQKLFRPNHTTKDIFERIYLKNTWGSDESASGTGSELSKTKDLINYLNKIIGQYHIETIFDAPCGDFNWMRKVDLDKIQYVGGDIVDRLILENNRKYKSDHIEFVPWDLTTDKITKKYDLIITRDCFVHLSFEDIKKSINNIVESKSKYLLTTSFAKTNLNINTNTGGKWRPINLRLSPFDLPEPIDFYEETNAEAGWEGNKIMSLYLISDLSSYSLNINKL